MEIVDEYKQAKVQTAIYLRLSREDGDKTESFSIANQKLQLLDYLKQKKELNLYDIYIDENYTGTNFNRPAFKRMIQDIEEKKVQCVIVKDLSRLGRNLGKTTEYINEYFPSKKVRFIAVNDGVDKDYLNIDTSEDMMIDVKNLFNGFYPKDIARKVRSTFRTKQKNGQFIGAFACYGFRKDSRNHNQLVIDDYAAVIVKRIFSMYTSGMGKNTIAKVLNEEKVLCPSIYKESIGLKYHNGNRLEKTSYWTYSAVSRILENEMYIGNMVQNKTVRQMNKKRGIPLPREKWIVVENTHEAIIDKDTWSRTQSLLKRNTKQLDLNDKLHKFAGFIQCGDCGRAMVKIKRGNRVWYHCGSYNKYGKNICSIHSIAAEELERIILNDLTILIHSITDLKELIKEEQASIEVKETTNSVSITNYRAEMEKVKRKKERTYYDYLEEIISKEEYITYRDCYEKQIAIIQNKIALLESASNNPLTSCNLWIERLLQYGEIGELDREIITDMVFMIYVYENKTMKIVYNFSSI